MYLGCNFEGCSSNGNMEPIKILLKTRNYHWMEVAVKRKIILTLEDVHKRLHTT